MSVNLINIELDLDLDVGEWLHPQPDPEPFPYVPIILMGLGAIIVVAATIFIAWWVFHKKQRSHSVRKNITLFGGILAIIINSTSVMAGKPKIGVGKKSRKYMKGAFFGLAGIFANTAAFLGFAELSEFLFATPEHGSELLLGVIVVVVGFGTSIACICVWRRNPKPHPTSTRNTEPARDQDKMIELLERLPHPAKANNAPKFI